MKLLFHTKTLDIFWRITWGCFPPLSSLIHAPLQEVVCILLEILHVIKERVLPGQTTEEAEYVIPSCWQCRLLNSHISTVTAYWELGGSGWAADYIRRLCFYVDDLLGDVHRIHSSGLQSTVENGLFLELYDKCNIFL